MLDVSREGRVLRLTLNRPEKRNALNGALCEELAAAIGGADADAGVSAILLTGAGKSFCSGMDLGEMLTPAASDLAELHERLFTIGRRITTPLIAAVDGPAVAGGMGLVANAHIVIASEDATFGLTEIHIGLWPFIVFRAVTQAIGERRAIELSITGRIFDAREAAAIGLAHYLTPAADLESRATKIAKGVAESSPEGLRSGLWFVGETRGQDWEEAGDLARRVREELFATPDLIEGIHAFREKRRPQWPSIQK
jgi:enoyl-CoA hydratase/carnithine racemase